MTMTDRILDQLITTNIIEKEQEEIYRFGLEAMLLKAFHYTSYLLIAVFWREVPRFLIFFAAFLLIRKSAGGYHAKTKAGCYGASCLTVLTVIILLKQIILRDMWLWGVMILFVIADGIILWLAPLENQNRELDEEEIEYFRKRCRCLLTLENILILFLLTIQKGDYAIPIILAVICQSVLLLLQKKKGQEHNRIIGTFR